MAAGSGHCRGADPVPDHPGRNDAFNRKSCTNLALEFLGAIEALALKRVRNDFRSAQVIRLKLWIYRDIARVRSH